MSFQADLLRVFRASDGGARFSKRIVANDISPLSLHAVGAFRHRGSGAAGAVRIKNGGERIALTFSPPSSIFYSPCSLPISVPIVRSFQFMTLAGLAGTYQKVQEGKRGKPLHFFPS